MMNYSMINTQKVKTLQEKIAAYQTSLVTLKEGHTIEALLLMKSELDDIKIQVSQNEDLNESNNSTKQNKSNDIEVMKQLEIINKSVEEMNKEISFILNQLSHKKTTSLAPHSVENFPPNTLLKSQKIMEGSVKSVDFEYNPTNIPSFNDLQRIAGKMIITNDMPKNEQTPLQQNNEEIILEDKHFNEQYFRATDTFPGRIYNGLYKNKEKKPTIRFKNVNEKNAEIEELEEIENDLILVSENKSKEDRPSPLSVKMESTVSEFIPSELECNDQILSVEENERLEDSSHLEQKKEKSNSFFNIFKRWNKSDDL